MSLSIYSSCCCHNYAGDYLRCCLMQKYAGMKIFHYRKICDHLSSLIERLSNTGCTLSISTLCLFLFLSHSFISICYRYAVNLGLLFILQFFASVCSYIIEMKDEVKNM